MDTLGIIVLVLFFGIMALSYFFFLKELKNKHKNRTFKNKLIGFLICLVSPVVIILAYFCFEYFFLMDILKLEMANSHIERILKTSLIFTLNSILNFYLLKFYLRKINKLNEIELIGTE